jgi:hypothetical protein
MADEKKDFVINDRRTSSDKTEGSDERQKMQAQLPEVNFSTFIFSLHSSVLLQLGLIEEPGTGRKNRNLAAAKQTIDILGMLEEKTRGNLTTDEEGMLKNILYDLRVMYVKEVRSEK